MLITNLTNEVLLFIRYDQGDCILLKPGPCACGSADPAIRVPAAPATCSTLLPAAAVSRYGDAAQSVAAIEEVPGAYACRSSIAR